MIIRNRKMINIYRRTIGILAIVFLLPFLTHTVHIAAAETENSKEESLEDKSYLTLEDLDKVDFSFDKSSYNVIVNDVIKAEVKTNIPDRFMRISFNTDNYYASVDWDNSGRLVDFRGCYEGETVVTVTAQVDYCDSQGMYEGTKEFEAKTTVRVLGLASHSLMVGEQVTLVYRNYAEYADMYYSVEDTSVATISNSNNVLAVAAGYTAIYLCDDSGNRVYVGNLTVRVSGACISETEVTRAVGSAPYTLTLNDIPEGTVTWTSSRTDIASVDANGTVTPVNSGVTDITATHTAPSGYKTTYTCTFTVTRPVLNITSGNVAKNYSIKLIITGTTGKATWTSSKTNIASVYSGYYDYYNWENVTPTEVSATVYGNKKGSCLITAEVDGITLTSNITVTNPVIKKSFYVVTKGMKNVLKVTGTNSASVVKFSSSNPKVATVTSSGIVKAKANGYASISIEVDGATLGASINVGNKKAVKAVLNAMKVEGATYSQARRMQKGYYDCSSLVWRSYSPLGMYFGDRHYAPVAANEARYCASHKKTVPVKYYKKLNKLQPGDLLFFRGNSNGRYKNIYHVAIYIGQEGYGSYSIGRIIHANGSKVAQGYIYNQSNIVVIGRPFK